MTKVASKTVKLTAVEVFNRVKESVKNPKPKPIALGTQHTSGEYVRQGDLYFQVLPTTQKAKGLKAIDLKGATEFQLAPGTGRGSRHVVSDASAINVYRHPEAENTEKPNAGYYIKTTKDCSVVHPDHGTVNLEKGMWIAITYQLTFADVARRVQD